MDKLQNEGLLSLQEKLVMLDPVFSATAEIHNPQRVARALEVYYTSGRPISSFQQHGKTERPFHQILIALDRNREDLYQRINLRMDQMLAAGLVEEAKSVEAYRGHHALQTVGYKEVYGFLDNLYSEDEMVRLLKQNSRRYAKRQLTWFRHQGDYHWFDASDYDGVVELIKAKIGQ
jgi:tRNA dimethylallyltransferase